MSGCKKILLSVFFCCFVFLPFPFVLFFFLVNLSSIYIIHFFPTSSYFFAKQNPPFLVILSFFFLFLLFLPIPLCKHNFSLNIQIHFIVNCQQIEKKMSRTIFFFFFFEFTHKFTQFELFPDEQQFNTNIEHTNTYTDTDTDTYTHRHIDTHICVQEIAMSELSSIIAFSNQEKSN